MRFARAAAGLGVAVLSGRLASAFAQGPPPPDRMPPPGTMATSSATQPISPVALVTWVARYGADGARVIDLLVVWRGAQGWYSKGTRQGTSGGGSGGSFHTTIRYGGLDLQLDYNSETQTAQIQGKTVKLGDANVILVDDVDGASGPRVAGTARVEPDLPLGPTGYPRVEAVLRRSPEVVAFLRCDIQHADGRGVMDAICAHILGK